MRVPVLPEPGDDVPESDAAERAPRPADALGEAHPQGCVRAEVDVEPVLVGAQLRADPDAEALVIRLGVRRDDRAHETTGMLGEPDGRPGRAPGVPCSRR